MTVTSAGAPIGVVNEAALLSVPPTAVPGCRSPRSPARSRTGSACPVGIGGEDLIRAISARPAGEYLLLDPDGSIFGVLSTADVDRAFRAHA